MGDLQHIHLITINHLPDDTFQSIFELVRRTENNYFPRPGDKRMPCPRWNYITAVCRRWRAIAINTKSLWASVQLEKDHKDQFLTFLSRARDMPIHLEAQSYGSMTRLQDNIKTLATFKSCLRVRSMSIGNPMASKEINPAASSLIEALPSVMPDVTWLNINDGRGDPMACCITQELIFPGLRNLHISAGVLDWSLEHDCLRYLEISASSIVLPQILDTLRNCPLLENVTIRNTPYERTFRPVPPRFAYTRPLGKVTLQNMKTFVFEDDHDHVAGLFQSLVFPDTVDLQAMAHNHHLEIRLLVINSVIKTFVAQPSFTDIRGIHIEPAWRNSINIRFNCGTDKTGTRQFALGRCSPGALSDFGRNLSAHSEWALITHLSIDMTCNHLPNEPVWADILDTVPSLCTVDIKSGWIRAESQFFDVLRPQINNPGMVEMRCVHLRDVRITDLRIRKRPGCIGCFRCRTCQNLMRTGADPQSWKQCKCWDDNRSQRGERPNEHVLAKCWAEHMRGWLESRWNYRAVAAPISLTVQQEKMCPLHCQALQPDDYSSLTPAIQKLTVDGIVCWDRGEIQERRAPLS